MKYANMHGYSDIKAHEIVRSVFSKILEVRAMTAKLLNGVNSGEPDALQFEPGGFFGHTSGIQRYEYTQDTSARVFRIRLHKDGKWRDAVGRRFVPSDSPREFYDFNF